VFAFVCKLETEFKERKINMEKVNPLNSKWCLHNYYKLLALQTVR